MRRLLALFLLSLPLVASAHADEKGLQRAVAEWRALFQPLKGVRMTDAGSILERIAREAEAKNDALRDNVDELASYRVWQTALGEGVAALEGLFARSGPRERRTLLRFYAAVGDLYEDSDVPDYPTCGTGLSERFDYCVRLLFLEAVAKEPAAYLGLLNDSDPRVADLAVQALHETYPDEVRTRIVEWANNPQARFRGIAAVWATRFEVNQPLLGKEAQRKIVLGLLDDPSEDVRDQVLEGLTEEQAAEEYRARLADFAKAREGRKWTALRLGTRTQDPSVGRLALASLSGSESLIKAALWATRSVEATVPKPTLMRLFRHLSPEVRELAYDQASIQDVSVAEIQPGFADPVKDVADAAFDAACRRAATREEFLLLFRKVEKEGDDYDVTEAAGRLGELVVPEILALLADPIPKRREWAVEMACLNGSKRLLPALRGLVDDPTSTVRKTLIGWADELPKEAARDLLKLLANDPDEKNRMRALEALAELDEESSETEGGR